nr:class D sortase [Lysinibacillus timonensis]
MQKLIQYTLLIAGLVFISVFIYRFSQTNALQEQALEEANNTINRVESLQIDSTSNIEKEIASFKPQMDEAFAKLEIPKLGRTLPIVEGTDADALDRGVGHLTQSVFPGQGEQIVLSGHRDTVFRNFSEIEIGDLFIIEMPYGTFTYEIKETEIVHEDDTTVIRKMGEEVLVVTTCYPFNYVGHATERFILYAYPYKGVEDGVTYSSL